MATTDQSVMTEFWTKMRDYYWDRRRIKMVSYCNLRLARAGDPRLTAMCDGDLKWRG